MAKTLTPPLVFDQAILWTLIAGEHARRKIRLPPAGAIRDIAWLRRSRMPGPTFCRAVLENA